MCCNDKFSFTANPYFSVNTLIHEMWRNLLKFKGKQVHPKDRLETWKIVKGDTVINLLYINNILFINVLYSIAERTLAHDFQ